MTKTGPKTIEQRLKTLKEISEHTTSIISGLSLRTTALEQHRKESLEYNKQVDFDNEEIKNYNESHNTLEARIKILEEKILE